MANIKLNSLSTTQDKAILSRYTINFKAPTPTLKQLNNITQATVTQNDF